MSHTVINVENISKSYLLKHQQKEKYVALRDVIANRTKSIFAAKKSNQYNTNNEEFWALKDVSFEVKQGDRIGIIGRNGAGKSTLLKVLSRIVTPTSGRITIEGRVASLLEVGTGFHPELSGRENIFLNGSILGMSKREIQSKFDEIVAFAEVEKFLDTPVKRYSSGMYVRLAFAVAAHLEPEILIVDEVLAVGDAEFQKKCLGKMKDVSTQGRTVLFVSHNIGQISSLCSSAILLDKGKIILNDQVAKVINVYNQQSNSITDSKIVFDDNLNKEMYIKSIVTMDSNETLKTTFAHDQSISLEVKICVNQLLNDVLLGIHVYDNQDRRIFTSELAISDKTNISNTYTVTIPANTLTPNNYKFSLGLHIPNVQVIDEHTGICPIKIYDNGSRFYKYSNVDIGCVFVDCVWKY